MRNLCRTEMFTWVLCFVLLLSVCKSRIYAKDGEFTSGRPPYEIFHLGNNPQKFSLDQLRITDLPDGSILIFDPNRLVKVSELGVQELEPVPGWRFSSWENLPGLTPVATVEIQKNIDYSGDHWFIDLLAFETQSLEYISLDSTNIITCCGNPDRSVNFINYTPGWLYIPDVYCEYEIQDSVVTRHEFSMPELSSGALGRLFRLKNGEVRAVLHGPEVSDIHLYQRNGSQQTVLSLDHGISNPSHIEIAPDETIWTKSGKNLLKWCDDGYELVEIPSENPGFPWSPDLEFAGLHGNSPVVFEWVTNSDGLFYKYHNGSWIEYHASWPSVDMNSSSRVFSLSDQRCVLLGHCDQSEMYYFCFFDPETGDAWSEPALSVEQFYPLEMCAEKSKDIQFVRGEATRRLMVIEEAVPRFEVPSEHQIADLAMDNHDRLWILTRHDRIYRIYCREDQDSYTFIDSFKDESGSTRAIELIIDGTITPWLSVSKNGQQVSAYRYMETDWIMLELPDIYGRCFDVMDPDTPVCVNSNDIFMKYLDDQWVEHSSLVELPGTATQLYAIDGLGPMVVKRSRYGGGFQVQYYLDETQNWIKIKNFYDPENGYRYNRDNGSAYDIWTHYLYDFRKFTSQRIPDKAITNIRSCGAAIVDNRIAAIEYEGNDLYLYKSWPELSLKTKILKHSSGTKLEFKTIIQDTRMNRKGDLQILIGWNDCYWFYPDWTAEAASVPITISEYEIEIRILDIDWQPFGKVFMAAGLFDSETGELITPHAWNYTIAEY